MREGERGRRRSEKEVDKNTHRERSRASVSMEEIMDASRGLSL